MFSAYKVLLLRGGIPSLSFLLFNLKIMKYFIIFFIIFSALFFTWCTQNTNKSTYTGYYIGQIHTWIIDYNRPINNNASIQQANHIPTTSNNQLSNRPQIWTLTQKKILSETFPEILFKDDKLIYSGEFSIIFPESLSEREYTNWGNQMIIFSNIQKKLYFSIVVGNTSSLTERENDEIRCKDIAIWSVSSTSKHIWNKTLYILNIIYPENTIPQKELCFVDKELVYRIWLINYDNQYTKEIFDSFHFIEKITNQNNNNSSVSESLQSIQSNPISSIYKNIILSWHKLIYSGKFTVELSDNLQYWKSIYPWNQGVEVFFTDKLFPLFQLDDVKYAHLLIQPITPISEWNNLNRCPPAQDNISRNKMQTITWNNGNIIYKNYRSYDSFWYLWKQWDLCFIDDSFIYTLSVRQYTISEVNWFIDSFTFLD